MIVDVHQYQCRYGTVQAQVKLYEEKGRPVVFGVGEAGDVDSCTHVMAFENAADRENRRAALAADPK